MKNLLKLGLISIGVFILSCSTKNGLNFTDSWECQIYPAEHVFVQDEDSGAKLLYATTDTCSDVNLYFDLNCWAGDQSMILFYSDRAGRNEYFGYLSKTGELVRLQPADQVVAGNATMDYQTHDIYVVRENIAYQWHFDIEYATEKGIASTVKVKERQITTAPEETSFFMGFTESANGRYLSAGLNYSDSDQQDIVAIDITSGDIKTLYTGKGISHVQFNKYNTNLLRFSHSPHRMWYIDIDEPGVAHKLHLQEPGELVTHEDWWVNDQMTFCGGYRKEQSHVKVVDIHNQITRILGGGSWLPDRTPAELSQFNWWHASGARNGRWVAADSWHGHIAVIDARTSHLRLLTKNHRTYGHVGVPHPHVGWAPDSKSVEFTSHKRGNADLCIAWLPAEWENPFEQD